MDNRHSGYFYSPYGCRLCRWKGWWSWGSCCSGFYSASFWGYNWILRNKSYIYSVSPSILGTAWGIIVGVWVIFNLIFVGVGGAIGSAARPEPPKPIKVEVQLGEKSTSVPNVEGTSKPVIAEPEMETRSSELVWTKEGRLLEIDVLRKRVLRYLLAYKKAELKTLASKV